MAEGGAQADSGISVLGDLEAGATNAVGPAVNKDQLTPVKANIYTS